MAQVSPARHHFVLISGVFLRRWWRRRLSPRNVLLSGDEIVYCLRFLCVADVFLATSLHQRFCCSSCCWVFKECRAYVCLCNDLMVVVIDYTYSGRSFYGSLTFASCTPPLHRLFSSLPPSLPPLLCFVFLPPFLPHILLHLSVVFFHPFSPFFPSPFIPIFTRSSLRIHTSFLPTSLSFFPFFFFPSLPPYFLP